MQPGLATIPFIGMMVSVVFAAMTQRVTGVGFAMVSGPLLVLGVGPHDGVLLANMLSLATNLIVLAQTWRHVELRRVALLAIPALLCIPIGRIVALHTPPAPLMIGIGAAVLLGLAALQLLPRSRVLAGTGGAVVMGALSGFMNVTAAVGAPPIAAYAQAIRWEQRAFIASAQLYFALLNASSIVAKGLPVLSAAAGAGLAAALALGLLAGHFAAGRIPVALARRLTLGLAASGAAATVIKGIWLLH